MKKGPEEARGAFRIAGGGWGTSCLGATGGMFSCGRGKGCKAKGQVRGEGIWRFLPGALYFICGVELLLSLCSVFVLLCVLAESEVP